jgi:uncharacterized repeat protein (TIGR01451 family)
MTHPINNRKLICSIAIVFASVSLGCAQLRIPSIDPTGARILSPNNSTQLLTPGVATGGLFGCRAGQNQPPQAGVFQPQPFTATPAPTIPQYPEGAAFQHPADPPPCNNPLARHSGKHHRHIVPRPGCFKTQGQKGQLMMTPSRIVAPVGSEVVVLAGICGENGYFVQNQPLEWMLSNDSVGEIIEVGGMNHKAFNGLVPPSSGKLDGKYAKGRTGLKRLLLSRGTPTPVDDIELQKGQTYISLASVSPGTSYVTGLAPKAEAWDRRRSSTIIHWVDGVWSIPAPANATAGTVYPLTTVISRATDGGGIKDWIVRYEIIGGAAAEFAPTGSQKVEAKSNEEGQATVQIRQVAGQFEPGTTQVRVDVVRPPVFGEPELVVESGVTSVTWSAPALTIRAIGPRTAGINQPFNYRVEVTNPGDQVARNVVVRTKNLDDSIEFISSTPKPTEYGRQYEWSIGDIAPGSAARVIDIQMKSQKRGSVGMCYEVLSDADQLRTEACAETEIIAPCIALDIDGPTTANVGDEVLFNLNVQNQCDEPLENIQLTIRHDQGLLRPGKSNPATFELPRLQFGETRSLPVTFNVLSPGTRCFDVEISAEGGHTATARRCIEVGQAAQSQMQSQIELDVIGGQPVEVGDELLLEIRVTNRGNVPLNNPILTNRFSSSIEPSFVSKGFNYDWLGQDELAIYLGQIAPGGSVALQLKYLGKIADDNATSELTVTSPTGAKDTEQVNLRVVPAGSLPGGRQPDQPNFGTDPAGPIGIPDQPAGPQLNLSVKVQAINPTIPVSNVQNPDSIASSQVQFVVKNERNSSMRDVDITILLQPGIRLTEFDYGETNLNLVNRNEDFTQFYLKRALELRAGEELRFQATVIGITPGPSTFEVQVQSTDMQGVESDRDTIIVTE